MIYILLETLCEIFGETLKDTKTTVDEKCTWKHLVTLKNWDDNAVVLSLYAMVSLICDSFNGG